MDRYRLDRLLGHGGMGEVWQAYDRRLRREIAIKALLRNDAGDGSLERFKNEALIGARLKHRGITVVHEIEQHENQLFIVMELLEGEDLARRLARSPGGLPAVQAVGFAAQAADALAAIHEQGIVHRDLKPANLFWLNEGQLKICDFGIARSVQTDPGSANSGWIVGTAPYMAPEQWRSKGIGPPSDLYALGCVLYELLTGNPPFPATGEPMALMHRHVDETPAPLTSIRADFAVELETLVATLLAKDQGARPDARTAAAQLKGIEQALLERHKAPTERTPPPSDSGPKPRPDPHVPPPPPPRPLPPYYDHLRDPAHLIPVHRLSGRSAGAVKAVAFSPDGSLFATGGPTSLGTVAPVQLWNPRTKRPLRRSLKSGSSRENTKHNPSRGVRAVAFSPDGTLLITGGTDGVVRAWDTRTRRALYEFAAIDRPPIWNPRSRQPITEAISTLRRSPRDTHTRRSVVKAVEDVFAPRVYVALSPDGTILATAGSEDRVRLWDPRTGRPRGEPLVGHTGNVAALAFSPDGSGSGSLFATGGSDGTVRLWDPRTGLPVGEPLVVSHEPVLAVAFSPDGSTLATAGGEDRVRLWDPHTGRPRGEPLVGRTGNVAALAFSPDGSILATGGSGRSVWLWDTQTRQPLGRPLADHTGAICALAFSPDGRLLATVDKAVRLYEIASFN